MNRKIKPVFKATQELDRSGYRGFDVVTFGEVVDSITDKNLFPGKSVVQFLHPDDADISVATICNPEHMAYALHHLDGRITPLDYIEVFSFYPGDSRLYELAWVDQHSLSWRRPFFRDYVWQENGGYQPKFTTLPVVWDSKDPQNCKVQFIEKTNDLELLKPYQAELRKLRADHFTTMSPQEKFEYWKNRHGEIFLSARINQVKIDILPQKRIYWIHIDNFNKI